MYLEELSTDLSAKESEFNTFKDEAQTEINSINAALTTLESTNVEVLFIKRAQKETSEKITKLENEVALLNANIKRFRFLDIFLSIITLSIYFFVLKSKNNKLRKEIALLNKTIDELNVKLENYAAELATMTSTESDIKLKQKLDEWTQKVNQKQKELEAFKEHVFDVFRKYSVKVNSVSDVQVAYFLINSHYEKHLALNKKLNDVNFKLKNYDIKKINSDLNSFALLDEEELNRNKSNVDIKNDELIKKITALEKQIEANEDLASNLENYKFERDELRTTMQNYEQKKELLTIARTLLEHANQQLAARYLTPLQNNVNDLLTKIKLEGYSVMFDGNSEMKLKDLDTNEYYDFAYYSAVLKSYFKSLTFCSAFKSVLTTQNPVFFNFSNACERLVTCAIKILFCAPVATFITAGVIETCRSFFITIPVTPKASALLIIAPRLCGSLISSNTKIIGLSTLFAAIISSSKILNLKDLTTATIP